MRRSTIHRLVFEWTIHTLRGVRGKRTGVCHGTTQVVIRVGVAPRKMRACQPKNILDLLCEHTLRPCDSNFLAIHRSTMLQSGGVNRSAMRHRRVQLW